jgi:hypothetical protein
MILDVAETLDSLLNARARRVEQGELDIDEDEDAAETTLQLIFFDGEEAFVFWTDTDSIYGARSVYLSPPSTLHSRISPPTAPPPPPTDTSPKHGGRPTCPRTQNAA